jgi:hypothetical protein
VRHREQGSHASLRDGHGSHGVRGCRFWRVAQGSGRGYGQHARSAGGTAIPRGGAPLPLGTYKGAVPTKLKILHPHQWDWLPLLGWELNHGYPNQLHQDPWGQGQHTGSGRCWPSRPSSCHQSEGLTSSGTSNF